MKKKSIKQTALDFVCETGPSTFTEIKKVMYEYRHGKDTFDSYKHRGWYSSYFSEDRWGSGAILLKGSERLEKADGKYYYVKDNDEKYYSGRWMVDSYYQKTLLSLLKSF